MTKEQLWQAVLGELELKMTKANFTTWFKNSSIVEYSDEEVVIGVPNTFTQDWLEKKYGRAIVSAIGSVTERQSVKIVYVIDSARGIPRKDKETATAAVVKNLSRKELDSATSGGLNPKYKFETFIVGKTNDVAHAASLKVASELGTKYNPLFIYGGVGLGKTHLLQAVGHQVLQNDSSAKVFYLNAEKFTNDFVRSIREGVIDRFRKFYREVDLLLVDDIQFIAGKESTQEEFFHTFNTLHQLNKQIVISSDRPPQSIPALEERLRSRFVWGMIADISSPDFETRVAILESKLREKEFKLEQEIIHYVADQIQSNVRELEGALNKIIAFWEVSNRPITEEVAKNVLESLSLSLNRGSVTIRELIDGIAAFYEITVENLISACRKKELVIPRQVAMYLLREELDISYPTIGHELGGRDHTTAMHAYQKISREVAKNSKLKQEVDLIKQRLYQNSKA